MRRPNTRPAGRTTAGRRKPTVPPSTTAQLYELGRAIGRGQAAPAEVPQRQSDRDYWAGYADAISDLYGTADRAELDAPEQTGTDNVTDLAAYRCGARPVRPRGGSTRRAGGGR